jgi:hypothetical protein
MSPVGASSNLYRTALDLVSLRVQDQYELFESVLEELDTDYSPSGVLGVMGIAHLTVQKVAACSSCAPIAALDGLWLHPTPLVEPVLGDVFTMLYLTDEDLPQACRMARDLGGDERAQPSMVVLADVSVAMVQRVSRFAGLPRPTVVAAFRQQVEGALADGTWAA